MAKQLEILTVDLRMLATQHDAQAKKSATAVKSYAAEAKKAESSSAVLSTGFGNAANQAAVLYGPLNGLSGRLSSVSSGLSALGVVGFAAAASLAGVALVVSQSLDVFGEWESQQLKTEALIRSTGNAAGFTSEQLEAMARSNALSTLGDVEGAREAINIMQTFKTVQGDTFEQAIELSHDLSAVMGGDAKSAALQLGKALEDPTTGLTALKRSGVSFSETEKQLIKDLQDHNKLSEAQAVILNKVNAQVGGAGVAAAQGLKGAYDTLGQSYDEFLYDLAETENLGGYAMTAVNALARSISNLNKYLFPDDKARFNELAHLREDAQEVLDMLGPAADQNFFQRRRSSSLQEDVAEYNKEMAVLQDKEVARQKAIIAAQRSRDEAELARKNEFEAEKAKAAQESAEKQAATEAGREKAKAASAAAAAASQYQSKLNAGASYLSQLDLQYADEATKEEMQHQSRLQKINQAVISEVEARRRGYESTAALREEYAQKEKEFYLLKKQEEDQAKLDDITAFLEEELSAADRELLAAQNRQMMIDEALGAREDSEEVYRNASIKNWQKYEKNLAELERERKSEQLQASSELFNNLSGLAEQFAGEQSGVYKAMFIASKAFAIADSIIKIQQGIAAAAATPWPLNIAAIGSVITATSGIVSTIQGTKYHTGGIIGEQPNLRANEVPIIGLKGEEVLTESDPRHRNNLNGKSLSSSGSGSFVININNNAEPVTGTGMMDEEGRIQIFLEKADSYIASGIHTGFGETSQAIEGVLGGNRAQGLTR